MTASVAMYIIVMAGVTYLIRMLPFAAFRFKLKSKFIKDFLFYIPYAVLGAMTIPYVFYGGADVKSSLAGFIVAFLMAYKNFSLLIVAFAGCATAFLMTFL